MQQQEPEQISDTKQELAASDQDELMNKSAEMMMTLNRLNTQESEVDVEGLASNDVVKMEFEAGQEEMVG